MANTNALLSYDELDGDSFVDRRVVYVRSVEKGPLAHVEVLHIGSEIYVESRLHYQSRCIFLHIDAPIAYNAQGRSEGLVSMIINHCKSQVPRQRTDAGRQIDEILPNAMPSFGHWIRSWYWSCSW